MAPFKYSFYFCENKETKGIRTNAFCWELSSSNNLPINCWNYDKNECGILVGNGIDWKNKTIYESDVYLFDLSPLYPNSRSVSEKMNDFLKALESPTSNWLGIMFKVIRAKQH